MKLQESGEMYLEAILVLSKEKSAVRSLDVADYLGYSKPSVSRAVGILRRGGMIMMDENGFLTLTDGGRSVAEKIYERHTVIRDLLISLGVGEKNAVTDACRVEHVISDETFDAIKKNIRKK